MELGFKGLMAPVFTPFDEDGSINLSIIPRYAEYLFKNAVKGVLVNGTSGEGMSLSVAERKILAETWIKSAKPHNIHVMVQIGGAPLPDVLELASHAQEFKADSILCLPDLYVKPENSNDLIEYLKVVAKTAPKIPLLYYHIPMFTHVNIHMGNFLKKIGRTVNSFVGIKFTSNDLAEGNQAVLANKKQFSVLLGADTLILPACVMGFDSFIVTSLNIFPGIANRILHGRNPTEQNRLTNLVECITNYGGWVPTMKATMTLLTPLDCGPVRMPMKQHLSEAQISSLINDLQVHVNPDGSDRI